jgi:hypothetical protein
MRADSSSIHHRTARFAGPQSDRTGLEIDLTGLLPRPILPGSR